jgi:hypothetical protein
LGFKYNTILKSELFLYAVTLREAEVPLAAQNYRAARRHITLASPHWTASFRRGGLAAGGLEFNFHISMPSVWVESG